MHIAIFANCDVREVGRIEYDVTIYTNLQELFDVKGEPPPPSLLSSYNLPSSACSGW